MVFFMKYFSKIIISATLISIMLINGCVYAVIGYTKGTNINMRADKSTSSMILDTISKNGTRLNILDESDEKWVRVEYNGKKGYIASQYVISSSSGYISRTVYTQTSDINIRSGRGTSYSKVTSISNRRYIIDCGRLYFKHSKNRGYRILD